MIDLQKVKEAKHIVISTKNSTFANANALYSYLLSLHKKVSLFSSQDIERQYSFLPWYEKVRVTLPTSSDMVVTVDEDTNALIHFFKSNDIKLNIKMATSLYSGLLEHSKNFRSDVGDGITFALASELIELGAEYKLADEYLNRREPLARFRLRAALFADMRLSENGSCANLFVSLKKLEASGADIEDAYIIMQEALNIVNVVKVTLLDSDKNKILKLIKDV